MRFRTKILPRLLIGVAALGAPDMLAAQEGSASERQDDLASAEDEQDDPAIIVTGSRIRGARIASEVTVVDREEIEAVGQIDLGEAIRALPQNFSGGQNPGVGTGAGLANQNINSASSANLRGLGPDATLTLLNGRRLPYDSAFQGVDISAIPLAALDRIEVVRDGASALYGSDAVAGVVNVILRRDFDGIAASSQIGAATEGGNFRQQFDLVAGMTGDRGGGFIAYDFVNNSDIEARQRDYTSSLDPDRTLFPSQERHAITASGYFEVSPGFEFSMDALYSNRRSTLVGGTAELRQIAEPEVESFTIAPTLAAELGAAWEAELLGVYGQDRTRLFTSFVPQNGETTMVSGCFCNDLLSIEASAQGPLFALPGGDARLALGGGFRNNGLDRALESNGTITDAFDATRESRFVFGEVFLPLISPRNEVSWVRELSVTAALRHEDYIDLEGETTPRIGVLYAPSDGFTLKASWGRSFKAPTLFQQFTQSEAILLPAVAFGAGEPGQTVFFASGGNPEILSERAETWSAGFEVRPQGLPEFTLSATYFDIRYRDRVVSPIAGSLAVALNDPGFASLIDFSPSAGQLGALIDGAVGGLRNFSGGPFDPANVFALIDNRNTNVAFQDIRGIDAAIAWSKLFSEDRSLSFNLVGSWLESDQQLTSDLPPVELAGNVFNPPSYRARGTASYRSGPFSGTIAINYIGELDDRRFDGAQQVDASANVEVGVSYAVIRSEDREPRLSISLFAQNLFDDEPDIIGQTGPTDTPFDSTNYSPIGRFIALGVQGSW